MSEHEGIMCGSLPEVKPWEGEMPTILWWFKQPCYETLRSVFATIANETGDTEEATVWGFWLYVKSLAATADDRGLVPDIDPAGYCRRHGGTPEQIAARLQAFRKHGLITEDGRIAGFDKLQAERGKDAERADRKRMHDREAKRIKREQAKMAAMEASKGSPSGASSERPEPKPDANRLPASTAPDEAESFGTAMEPASPAGKAVPADGSDGRDADAMLSEAGGQLKPGTPAPEKKPLGRWAYAAWEKITTQLWIADGLDKAKDAWLRLCARGKVTEDDLEDVFAGLARQGILAPLMEATGINAPSPPKWIAGRCWRDESLTTRWPKTLEHWQDRAEAARASKSGAVGKSTEASLLSEAGEQTRQNLAELKQAWKTRKSIPQEEHHVDVNCEAAIG
ncbi:MAG: hypothetical protein K6E40_01725 [Desulfovibrio sp.]|nr:hypothetical protein [Desulfovibrio sp.]